MPLKFFFKLYSIPVLIVVVGICLYFFVFVEIKDKRVPSLYARHSQPIEPADTHLESTSSKSTQSPKAQEPVVVAKPEPEIILEEIPQNPNENLAQESKTPDSASGSATEANAALDSNEPHAPQALPATQPHYVYVNVRSANIRTLPSTDGGVLYRANSGTRLTLIQTLPESDWSEVEVSPGVRGYIASYLLSDQSPQYDMYQVVVRSANIRALPSSDAPIIAAVGFEHNVRVLQNDGEWSKILLESGQEGYIASRLLKK